MPHYNLRILFIRHAQSQANTTPDRIAGRSPQSPLSSKGSAQAQALGTRLSTLDPTTTTTYSSPLLRAQETARIALQETSLPAPILVENLQEFTNGDWDRQLRSEIYTPTQKAQVNTAGYLFIPPNGESQRMVQRRASNWLEDEIIYNPQFQTDYQQTILIFSHAIVIKTLLHYILGFSDRYIYRFALENTAICEFKFTEEGWFPVSINDSSHL